MLWICTFTVPQNDVLTFSNLQTNPHHRNAFHSIPLHIATKARLEHNKAMKAMEQPSWMKLLNEYGTWIIVSIVLMQKCLFHWHVNKFLDRNISLHFANIHLKRVTGNVMNFVFSSFWKMKYIRMVINRIVRIFTKIYYCILWVNWWIRWLLSFLNFICHPNMSYHFYVFMNTDIVKIFSYG